MAELSWAEWDEFGKAIHVEALDCDPEFVGFGDLGGMRTSRFTG
jgi:hypothetical protein